MSDEAELEALLRQLIVDWENEVVEFKAAGEDYSTGTIGKYFSALSNEANLRGNASAWLVFGVDNKTHTIVGTKYGKEPERLSQLKMQITRDTEPRSSFKDIHELNLPEGRVLMFEIPRIQLVSATAGFGSACFDCSLAISSSHTSL
ncbi:ATP-dependent DNA helicase, partial [Bifidobacterium bifidum LMG 13195]|uniref:ATP-binding protein n=2 Tax=Bifidobacterium bifidum TaxID=1681 RepID=UPI0002866A40